MQRGECSEMESVTVEGAWWGGESGGSRRWVEVAMKRAMKRVLSEGELRDELVKTGRV